MKRPLYGCMEPTITSGFIATGVENPVTEIQDFDRVVQFYWPRILRFVAASVRDRDVAETITPTMWFRRNSGDLQIRTLGVTPPTEAPAGTRGGARGGGGQRGGNVQQ